MEQKKWKENGRNENRSYKRKKEEKGVRARESEKERDTQIERKRDILRKGERERFVSLTERTSGKVSDDLRA